MPGIIDWFLAEKLGLTKLPEYLPTVVSSFLVFTFLHRVVAPIVSRIVAPVSYGAIKTARTRNTWGIHFASQVNVLLLVPLSLWCIKTTSRANDDHWGRAFGWDERAGFVNAIAVGYFLWDASDAIINFIDAGYVVHGFACLTIYTLSFKPFVSYYAVRCLLWESSTFFLNNHWFLDKTSRTGSTLQLVNGICLLVTFFFVRIVYGGITSYNFCLTLRHVYHEIPFFYTFVYTVGNVTLQGLNWYWLTKMVAALRKRFKGDAKGNTNSADVAPVANGNGHRK